MGAVFISLACRRLLVSVCLLGLLNLSWAQSLLESFKRFVAVKVLTIYTNRLIQSKNLEDEFALLDRIRSVHLEHGHPGKGHIVPVLDHFQHNGLHGVHTCLTFPVLGPSLSAFLYNLRSRKLGYELVKKFAKQLLLALTFLHDECKIIHTGQFVTTLLMSSLLRLDLEDLKPSNFALVIDNAEDIIRNCLAEGSDSDDKFRAAGHQSDPSLLPQIELRVPASQEQLSKLSIQLMDFGSG
jgi:serine/threonine-protein kinase SRPK3